MFSDINEVKCTIFILRNKSRLKWDGHISHKKETRNTYKIFVGIHYRKHMRFEVLMAEKMSLVVFWVLMPCSLVDGYHNQHHGRQSPGRRRH
jgi:hypothetical protein